MSKIAFHPHTQAGVRIIELIDEIMRLNGRWLSMAKVLAEGTELRSMTGGLVLVAVVCAAESPTVARIARSLGYSRQAVQKQANKLAELGYIRFEDNPRHKRAKQLLPTKTGIAAYELGNAASVQWADRMGSEMGERELARTVSMLCRVRRPARSAA